MTQHRQMTVETCTTDYRLLVHLISCRLFVRVRGWVQWRPTV